MDNDFLDSFSQLFGSSPSPKSKCETCGYKAYSDKIKYIKNKMISGKKLALESKNRLEYLELTNNNYNEILQYLRKL